MAFWAANPDGPQRMNQLSLSLVSFNLAPDSVPFLTTTIQAEYDTGVSQKSAAPDMHPRQQDSPYTDPKMGPPNSLPDQTQPEARSLFASGAAL